MRRYNRRRCGRRRLAQPSFLSMAAFCILLISGVALHAIEPGLHGLLPSISPVKRYHPPLVTSIYASDGSLIAEYCSERRYIISLSEAPPHLLQAILAAEDARFYEHGGLDLQGIARAMLKNIRAGEVVQGGSTITQQVVKSLLLSSERTWGRKLKEAILAYLIDKTMTKDEILHLYINQIYFGAGAYGVEAAARAYFDKSAGELSLAEAALLSGLPKAPSRTSPLQNIEAARERQRYVLTRMTEAGFINKDEAYQAYAEPLRFAKPRSSSLKNTDYFTEEVRRQVEARFGRDALYKEGLHIHTTLDLNAQRLAERALDHGLREIDKRHSSYRGLHLSVPAEDWPTTRRVLIEENGALMEGKIVSSLVLSFDVTTGLCLLDLGEARAKMQRSGWDWTKASMKRASRMFRVGDIVRVRLESHSHDDTWNAVLEQDPEVEGALMAINPATGEILCMVGGRSFEKSQFNRCTQAMRQPGSAFKPIIYAAALDKGYTASSILIDSPLSVGDGSIRGQWRPKNYDLQFWGPIPLRRALVHSRNIPTVKLLSDIGIDYAIDYARKLGINSPLPSELSLALGSSGVSLRELVTAYTPFANAGNRVEPHLIEHINDRNGKLIDENQLKSEQAISSQTAYIMTHLLSAVVEEGTGARAKAIDRPAAGKTGTTNEMKDAWFVGYTPSVLAGVWVGYDNHRMSLGKGETGGRAACPIWVDFMREFLKDSPVETFAIPSGIVMTKMNPRTGAIGRADDSAGVYAAFAGEPPTEHASGNRRLKKAAKSPSREITSIESFFKSELF